MATCPTVCSMHSDVSALYDITWKLHEVDTRQVMSGDRIFHSRRRPETECSLVLQHVRFACFYFRFQERVVETAPSCLDVASCLVLQSHVYLQDATSRENKFCTLS
jgi:hypothetical protein